MRFSKWVKFDQRDTFERYGLPRRVRDSEVHKKYCWYRIRMDSKRFPILDSPMRGVGFKAVSINLTIRSAVSRVMAVHKDF